MWTKCREQTPKGKHQIFMTSTFSLSAKKKQNKQISSLKHTLTGHRSQKNSQAKPKFSEWLHRDSAHRHDGGHGLWFSTRRILRVPFFRASVPVLSSPSSPSCFAGTTFVFTVVSRHVSSTTRTALSATEQHIEKCREDRGAAVSGVGGRDLIVNVNCQRKFAKLVLLSTPAHTGQINRAAKSFGGPATYS